MLSLLPSLFALLQTAAPAAFTEGSVLVLFIDIWSFLVLYVAELLKQMPTYEHVTVHEGSIT